MTVAPLHSDDVCVCVCLCVCVCVFVFLFLLMRYQKMHYVLSTSQYTNKQLPGSDCLDNHGNKPHVRKYLYVVSS